MILLRKHIDSTRAQLQEIEDDIAFLKKNRSKRLMGFFLMLVTATPQHLAAYFLIESLGLILPRWKRRARAKLLKDQTTAYFNFRGFDSYPTVALPEQFPEPSLIFVTRHSDMSSLFAYHLFPSPVIIPIAPSIKRQYRLHPFLPGLLLTKAIQHVSYPDKPLAQNVSRIQDLLKAGYSVVVHINENYVDPRFYDKMPVSKAILPLLEHSSIYFMNFDGIEYTKRAHHSAPYTVRCDFIEKSVLESLLFDSEKGQAESLMRVVSQFYGFDHFEWI
jgi:hypothetical protein